LLFGNLISRSEERQVYCQDCNTGNTVDSKYCKECGAKINSGYRTLMLSIQDLPLHQSDEDVEKLTRLLDMAFWHNQAGNQDAAITACEAALALNPNSTTAHSLLGTLCEKTGDDEKAIRHFEAVLALNPESQADAVKLEQLRRGVHVRAAAPPLTHQWLPPVMLKLGPQLGQKWVSLASSSVSANLTQVDPQRKRLLAAGAATALVAVGGLILAHPWAQAETVRTYPVTTAAAPPAVSVSRSAFAPEVQPASAVTPPMVLLPSHANSNAPGIPPEITANDPFAGHIPADPSASVPSGAGSPLWTLPAVLRSGVRRRTGQDLPPLRLAALPAVGSIAPAPVTLPPGIVPAAAPVDSLPRHTVMVSSFGSAAPALNSSSASPYQSSMSSHIRISVHQAADTDASVAGAQSGASDSVAGNRVAGGSGQGEAEQQRALSLQEAGSYSQARQAYQSAIRSYQAQIAAGQNTETAQRGLAACQTGLQICEQSQP